MAQPRHLLLLSEDAGLATLLAPILQREGGFSLTAAKPAEAESVAGSHPWHAALADGEVALAALLGLARRGVAAPVLLLGPAGAAAAGLPAGAAAALRKPVRAAELLAALARLAKAPPLGELRLGRALSLDAAGRWLFVGAARLRLTEKEAAILLHLHRAASRPVPKEELLGEVWGYAAGIATHTLETHLYRLRRKLAAAGEHGLVVTEPQGYRLAPP